MSHLGTLANVIFVVCSSWFLVDRKKDMKNKIIKLWSNSICISILFLLAFLCFTNIQIDFKKIISAIFPNFFGTNWFITTYLIFIMIVPFLNQLIETMNQRKLFRLCMILFILYFVLAFAKNSFSANEIIYFITIYFITAYSKKYMQKYLTNKKVTGLLIIFSIIGIVLMELITVYLATKFDFFNSKLLYWAKNNNPFFLIFAIGMFYKFKGYVLCNKFINSVSSLSLYVYLIHENLLFRYYTRVYIWHYLYVTFGYEHKMLFVLVYAIILFVVALIASYIYKMTFEKLINLIVEKLLNNKKIKNIYLKLENILLGAKQLVDTNIK